jgi:hypothetical protein
MKKENTLPINAFYITYLRDRVALSPVSFLIYLMLLSRADSKTLTCFPSIETICNDCKGVDRRTVWNCLNELEKQAIIKTERQKGKANIYTVEHFKRWKQNPTY